MATLFEQLGADDALEALVKKFYQLVLIDPLLQPFFIGNDMDKLMAHQRMFLKYVLNGAPKYQGRSIAEAHRPMVERLGLTDVHFDQVVVHLVTALKKLGAQDATIASVVEIVETTRDDVLSRDNTITP